MQEFISHKQLFEYLIAGGKLKNTAWKNALFIFMAATGNLHYNDGTEFAFNFMASRQLDVWVKHNAKKRFWLWKINDDGWRVTQAYMSEEGHTTDGRIYGGKGWGHYEKQKLNEADFIEI